MTEFEQEVLRRLIKIETALEHTQTALGRTQQAQETLEDRVDAHSQKLMLAQAQREAAAQFDPNLSMTQLPAVPPLHRPRAVAIGATTAISGATLALVVDWLVSLLLR